MSKIKFFIVLLMQILILHNIFAQNDTIEGVIFEKPKQPAKFKGNFSMKYPALCRELAVEATFSMKFVVEINGKISNI